MPNGDKEEARTHKCTHCDDTSDGQAWDSAHPMPAGASIGKISPITNKDPTKAPENKMPPIQWNSTKGIWNNEK